MIIYLILVIMFAIVGNLNFLFDTPSYATLFDSLMTILDSSMGNYDFTVFSDVKNDG